MSTSLFGKFGLGALSFGRFGLAYPFASRLLRQEKPDMKKTVDAQRPELMEVIGKYTKIRDCLMGEDNIKAKGELYLPISSTKDSSTPET